MYHMDKSSSSKLQANRWVASLISILTYTPAHKYVITLKQTIKFFADEKQKMNVNFPTVGFKYGP